MKLIDKQIEGDERKTFALDVELDDGTAVIISGFYEGYDISILWVDYFDINGDVCTGMNLPHSELLAICEKFLDL